MTNDRSSNHQQEQQFNNRRKGRISTDKQKCTKQRIKEERERERKSNKIVNLERERTDLVFFPAAAEST